MNGFSKIILSFSFLSLVFLPAAAVLAQASSNDVSSLVQECGNQTKPSGQCRDVGIFVVLLIRVGKYVFSIIGALALLFFVYGGFTLILSQGNSEKVKKGMGIMSAAFIGLVIVFGAYFLVNFLSNALGVK
jgi:hypothetical protein